MKIIAIDTEYNKNAIPFIGTTCDDKLKGKFFDLRTKSGITQLKKICLDKSVRKIFHSATADIYALSNIGIKVVPPYECTLIAARLLNENFASAKLKEMARIHLNAPCDEEKELSKVKAKLRREAKKNGKIFDYSMIPAEIIKPYALQDPVYTIKLWFLFKRPLLKYKELYEFEKTLIPIIVKMQQRGFRIDRKFCLSQIKDMKAKLEDLLLKIRKYAFYKFKLKSFNPASPKQISAVLEKLDLPIKEKTKTGNISTSSDVLQRFNKIPFIDNILKFKFYTKQLNTYYKPLYYNYTSLKSSIAHFSIWQSGTKTGRFSAELIQTIPNAKPRKIIYIKNRIKESFIPRDGYEFVSLDYKQIEMRLFICDSKSYGMIEKMKQGFDPHEATIRHMFGDDFVNKLTPSQFHDYREFVKMTSFGVLYGMGADKLLSTLSISGLSFSESKILEVLKSYHDKYPIKEYTKKSIADLYKQGSITISADSKLMKFIREYRVPRRFAYKSINVKIQGMAAYVMKYGIKRVVKAIKVNKIDAHLLITIHDEIVLEVRKNNKQKAAIKKLVRAMEDRVSFDLPMLVSAKKSTSHWGAMEKWENS